MGEKIIVTAHMDRRRAGLKFLKGENKVTLPDDKDQAEKIKIAIAGDQVLSYRHDDSDDTDTTKVPAKDKTNAKVETGAQANSQAKANAETGAKTDEAKAQAEGAKNAKAGTKPAATKAAR